MMPFKYALMRRLGITTHWIQFGILVAMIATDLFRCACLAIRHDWLDMLINIGCAAWLMVVAQRLANRIPAVPPKDLYAILPPALQAAYPLIKMLALFLLVMSAKFLAATAVTQSVNAKVLELPMDVASLACSLVVFFGIYLLRTPNEPPPKKKREAKGILVPQRSAA
jgi:hypothetical protein